MDNPGLERDLLDGSVGPFLSAKDCFSKCRAMSRRLIGRCQGLLEVVHTGCDFPYCHEVKFVHRTVADFLDEPNNVEEARRVVGDFDPKRAMTLGLLAMVKFINPNTKVSCRQNDDRQGATRQTGYLQYNSYSLDKTLHPLVQLVTLAEESGSKPLTAELESLQRMFLNHRYKVQIPVPFCCPMRYFPLSLYFGFYWEPLSRDDLEITISTIAACFGASKLVKAKLQRNPALLRHNRHSLLLAASIRESHDLGCEFEESLTKFVFTKNTLPNEHRPRAC